MQSGEDADEVAGPDRFEPDREPEAAAGEAGRVRDLDGLLADPLGPRPRRPERRYAGDQVGSSAMQLSVAVRHLLRVNWPQLRPTRA